MNKVTRFTITTLWLLFSRSYDAYSTYLHTPDLSKEANPLVSVFGFTWTPLLLVVGVLTLYVIYAYYRSVFHPMRLLPDEKGYTFSEVTAYMYHGRKEAWYSMFYRFPKDASRFHQYMGKLFTPCLVFAGVVSTLMWLLINYAEFYKPYHNVKVIYGLLVAGSAVIIFLGSKRAYTKYERGD